MSSFRSSIGRSKAIVTGGNSGIGEAVAKRLAADGAQVLLVARNRSELGRVAGQIRDAGGVADYHSVDLAAPDAAQGVLQAAISFMGGIDILVNCASQTHNGDFFELTDELWEAAFAVKVFAAIRLCRAAWPAPRGR